MPHLDPLDILPSLYSAVVADVLDSLGHRNQVLPSTIQALTPATSLCGRIFTARAIEVDDVPEYPYKLEMEAIERMVEGDVLVVDAGFHRHASLWGELLSTACQVKGVRGIVMSTCTRDLWALNQMDFPVFGIGSSPADSAGRLDVVDIGEPIAIGGVEIETGDWLLGDVDGVVVIPHEAASETLRLAREKLSGENTVRDEIRAGVPLSEVFRKHRIL